MDTHTQLESGPWMAVPLLVLCLVFAAMAAPVGVATATDDQDEPPQFPANYEGEVTINGDPAAEGVTIEAEIDGEVRGSITVDEAGQYGGPNDPEAQKLRVNGTSDDEGVPVVFYVDGDNFDRTEADTDPDTVEWESGSSVVDLTADVDIDDDDGPGGGPGAPGDPGDPKLTAAIDIDPSPATVGDTVTFDGAGSSVEDGEITTYDWEIDGEPFTGETVTASFDTAGSIDVQLTVTDDDGETDTTTDTLTVQADDDQNDDDADDTDDADDAADDDDADDEDPDDAADDGLPGFGAVVTLVAALSAIGLLVWRTE